MTDLYDKLGVKKDCSQEEIKKAYRKKAKEVHPDQNPDVDQKEIQELNHAYEVLANPAKRERYDRGEPEENIVDVDKQAMAHLAEMFFNEINGPDYAKKDIFECMKRSIRNNIKENAVNVKNLESEKKKFAEIKRRIKSKDKGNVFAKMLDAKIGDAEAMIVKIGMADEILSTAGLKLELYGYDWDKPVRKESHYDQLEALMAERMREMGQKIYGYGH